MGYEIKKVINKEIVLVAVGKSFGIFSYQLSKINFFLNTNHYFLIFAENFYVKCNN